jgi:hypothetical protein
MHHILHILSLCNIVCSEKWRIIFSDISCRTDYRHRFGRHIIIFYCGDNFPIIFDFERHTLNINCNMFIKITLWAISGTLVAIQIKPDFNKTKTDLVRWKTSDVWMVIWITYSKKKNINNQNIGRLKYRFLLLIFLISYLFHICITSMAYVSHTCYVSHVSRFPCITCHMYHICITCVTFLLCDS